MKHKPIVFSLSTVVTWGVSNLDLLLVGHSPKPITVDYLTWNIHRLGIFRLRGFEIDRGGDDIVTYVKAKGWADLSNQLPTTFAPGGVRINPSDCITIITQYLGGTPLKREHFPSGTLRIDMRGETVS